MSVEHQIDELITAGWYVLDSDFNPAAFRLWRVQAFRCVESVLGQVIFTTKLFEDIVSLQVMDAIINKLETQRKCFLQHVA